MSADSLVSRSATRCRRPPVIQSTPLAGNLYCTTSEFSDINIMTFHPDKRGPERVRDGLLPTRSKKERVPSPAAAAQEGGEAPEAQLLSDSSRPSASRTLSRTFSRSASKNVDSLLERRDELRRQRTDASEAWSSVPPPLERGLVPRKARPPCHSLEASLSAPSSSFLSSTSSSLKRVIGLPKLGDELSRLLDAASKGRERFAPAGGGGLGHLFSSLRRLGNPASWRARHHYQAVRLQGCRCRSPSSDGLLRYVDELLEGRVVVNRELGNLLTIEGHLGLVQPGHERAVRHFVRPGGGANANDPQSAEVPLLGTAIPDRQTALPYPLTPWRSDRACSWCRGSPWRA